MPTPKDENNSRKPFGSSAVDTVFVARKNLVARREILLLSIYRFSVNDSVVTVTSGYRI